MIPDHTMSKDGQNDHDRIFTEESLGIIPHDISCHESSIIDVVNQPKKDCVDYGNESIDNEIPILDDSERVRLDELPVDELNVPIRHVPEVDVFDDPQFTNRIYDELKYGKQIWRSSNVLAEKFKVDVIELDRFLRLQSSVCSKPSKNEGVFLYALISRLEEGNKTEIHTVSKNKQIVSEEDRYCLASINNALTIVDSLLKKHGLMICEKNPEAFQKLLHSKQGLETSVYLLASGTKADLSKLI